MNPLRYLASPRPFAEISTSTNKEIKERLNYVSSMRIIPHFKISEAEEQALLSYQDACSTLTEDSPTKQESETAKACIQEYEQSLERNNTPANLSFDLATKTKLGEELDNLWNMWIFTSYEKYLPEDIIEEARRHPSAQVSDPWHRAFWRLFQGRLEAETESFEKVVTGQNCHNECPTFLLLALLCERHTLDWDETVLLIRACAGAGDEVVVPGTDLVEFFKKRDLSGLATRLDRDEASISLSSEYVMGVGSLVLAFYASHLPEFLFDREEVDPVDWVAKEPLLLLCDLEQGQEQAFRFMMQEMFERMANDESDHEDIYDDWDNDDEFDEGAASDESEDY
ncbi:hypothetical protein BDV28DRAFT_135844 [Aspergillus coremiiformis]|uniref:Uncharacterized protein n=1 Tax=Aspergillus coremiiformis TaxID=138285 RepID=A0A5N6Z328_9EURO|nr:hypothetical protein BDV28DRAFT_135844 [Aspergillus coremiiformis]